MPFTKQHGKTYAEAPRADELNEGVTDPNYGGPQLSEKRDGSRFEAGDSAPREAGRKGGSAKRGKTALVNGMPDGGTLSPKAKEKANSLRLKLTAELAGTVGGGYCGPAPSLMAKWAAMKTAQADDAFERGDFDAFRKLSESARMDLVYAREQCAKDAEARVTAERRGTWRPYGAQARSTPRATEEEIKLLEQSFET